MMKGLIIRQGPPHLSLTCCETVWSRSPGWVAVGIPVEHVVEQLLPELDHSTTEGQPISGVTLDVEAHRNKLRHTKIMWGLAPSPDPRASFPSYPNQSTRFVNDEV